MAFPVEEDCGNVGDSGRIRAVRVPCDTRGTGTEIRIELEFDDERAPSRHRAREATRQTRGRVPDRVALRQGREVTLLGLLTELGNAAVVGGAVRHGGVRGDPALATTGEPADQRVVDR